MRDLLITLIDGMCAAHGCRAEIDYRFGVGPTVNDAEAAALAERVISGLVGDRYATMAQPLAGSEDFSEVLARVPGAFVFYSGVPAGRDLADATYNHSATAWFDDSVIGEAMAVYAALAHETLLELAGTD